MNFSSYLFKAMHLTSQNDWTTESLSEQRQMVILAGYLVLSLTTSN